jgi:hypothetical protein
VDEFMGFNGIVNSFNVAAGDVQSLEEETHGPDLDISS